MHLADDVEQLQCRDHWLRGREPMPMLRMKFINGEVAEMKVPKEGDSFCPVCGEAFFNYVPYQPDTQGVWSGTFDTCPNCEFVFGYSDSVGPDDPPGAVHHAWKIFRLRWLNRKGWTNDCLLQLQTSLSVDVEKLRKEAWPNISKVSYWVKKSKPLKGDQIEFEDGAIADRAKLEAAAWICPVCGAKLYSAWLGGGEDESRGRYDTCPSCEYLNGESDGLIGDTPAPLMRIRDEHRIRWLERNHWSKESLGQLQNLKINIAALKKEHGK